MDNKEKPIYLITTFTKLEPNAENKFFPNFGSTRAVAFYYSFFDAYTTVKYNNCDMWETCYDYAVIEELLPGMYPLGESRWFFKYNRTIDSYEPIGEPDFMKHYTNFTIG